jgi:hypothetical protein
LAWLSAGFSLGVGLLDTVEDVDGAADSGATLEVRCSGDAVHPTSTTRKATTGHAEGRSIVGRRRVIAKTLSGTVANALTDGGESSKV